MQHLSKYFHVGVLYLCNDHVQGKICYMYLVNIQPTQYPAYQPPASPKADAPSLVNGLSNDIDVINAKGSEILKNLHIAGLKLGVPTRITNFHKVDDSLYRGAELHSGQVKHLKKFGIKTIINLKDENDDSSKIEELEARKLGMNYINIPLDSSKNPSPEAVQLFKSIMDNYKLAPCYVHCKHGKDRTGIMVALYRVWKHGWDYDLALSDMHQKGYQQIYRPHLNKFLENYCNDYYGRKPQPSA
jgi:protein tyrosine/serine phosphatase